MRTGLLAATALTALALLTGCTASTSSDPGTPASVTIAVTGIDGYPVVRIPADTPNVTVPVGTTIVFDLAAASLANRNAGYSTKHTITSDLDASTVAPSLDWDDPRHDIPQLANGYLATTPGTATFTVAATTIDPATGTVVNETSRTHVITVTN